MSQSTSQLLLIALMVGVFWLLVIRPQQQQRKRQEALLDALKPSVRVVTIGGIVGTVEAVIGDRVLLRIADGVTIEVLRRAIGTVLDEREVLPEERVDGAMGDAHGGAAEDAGEPAADKTADDEGSRA